MQDNHLPVKQDGHGQLVVSRLFDAPREAVWRAWTDPERAKLWYGPKGYTIPVCRMDLRVGGTFLICMRSPEGKDYWSTGTYREIVPMERLVATDSFADEHGHVVPATYYGMGADFPLELLTTMTFEEFGGKTRFALRHSGLPVGDVLEMTKAGWIESFDKLAELLKTP